MGTIEAPRYWRTRPNKSIGNNSDGWQGHIRVGRFQFSFALWQHHYPASPDRWVFHPSFVYDRKRGAQSNDADGSETDG